MSHPRLLPLLAVAALLALLMAAALLVARHGAPAVAAHLAFALGVMPLILAAMSYFVPVLTRGPGATVAAWLPPSLALGGGGLVVFAFATDYSSVLIGLAALLGASAASGMGAWAIARARRMLGRRHPGLDWYLAALCLLVLALIAVILMPWFPERRPQLRLFHLHANLLGFVGLTALGTLQVLMPTCLGRSDPDAADRLRGDIKWAAGGCLLLAIGASSLLPRGLSWAAPAIAVGGGLLYLAVVAKMLFAWIGRFRGALLAPHGAASSLLAATLGLCGMLLLGFAHGLGYSTAAGSVGAFVVAFLLPLVSGAAAQLLPVWLRPGVQSPWHLTLRDRLCRWSGIRGFALLAAGALVALV